MNAILTVNTSKLWIVITWSAPLTLVTIKTEDLPKKFLAIWLVDRTWHQGNNHEVSLRSGQNIQEAFNFFNKPLGVCVLNFCHNNLDFSNKCLGILVRL